MGALSSLASTGLTLALQQQEREQRDKELKKQRKRDLKQLAAEEAAAEQERARDLRKRTAQERARAGAAGVGGVGGSIDAIVKGLEQESRAQQRERAAGTQSKRSSILGDYQSDRKRNLLTYNNKQLDTLDKSLSGTTRRNLLR